MAQKEYKTFEKFELPASRGKRNSCEICGKEFKLFVREHQCKRCGRSVCEECGSYKTFIYGANFERKPHRMCKMCQPESEFIKNYIQHYKLTFGAGSEIGEKWAKRISVQSEGDRSPTRIESRREVVFSEEMFGELWNSFNYSLREFIGSIIFERKQNEIYRLLYNTLQELGRRLEVRLQTTSYLLVWLLCFCNSEEATRIAYELLMLAKNDPPVRQNLTACLRQLNCEDGDRRKLEEYLDYRYRKFCSMFSINCVTFEGTLFILDQIISKRAVVELDRYFATIVFEQRKQIIENGRNKTEVDISIVRGLNGKITQKLYNTIGKLELKKRSSDLSVLSLPSPTRIKQSPLSESVPASPSDKPSLLDRSAAEGQIRRTVSAVEDEEAPRMRIQELEAAIASLKRPNVSNQTEKRDFRKKASSFDDDEQLKQLALRNQELQEKLASYERSLAKSGKEPVLESNSDNLSGNQERTIDELEQRLKKQSIDYSKAQLQLEGKCSILQKQLEIATKQKQSLAEELESTREEARKLSKQVKSLEGTLEIMRMKMETLELENRGSLATDSPNTQQLEELKKENSLLANSLKEKNQKIGDLLKQVKLLNFEIEHKEAASQVREVPTDKKSALMPPQSIPQQPMPPVITEGPNEKSGSLEGQTIEKLERQNRVLVVANERLMKKLEDLSRALVTEEEISMEARRRTFSEQSKEHPTETVRDQNCKPY